MRQRLEQVNAAPELWAWLLAWSRAAVPREACGLLLGRRDREVAWVARAVLGRNLAPEPDRFELNPTDFLRAHAAAQTAGLAVVGAWHSHVLAPPRPSPADRSMAWPELVQVIVGPAASVHCGIEAWTVLGRLGTDLARVTVFGTLQHRPCPDPSSARATSSPT